MKQLIWLFSLVFCAGVAAQEAPEWPTQDGVVTVIWQQPEEYADVRTGSGLQSRYQNHVFATLGKELQKSVTPLLQEGQQARFVVTDLDLAGDVRPSFGAASSDIRIVKSIYPPRIKFSYSIVGPDGQVVALGEEDLRDMGFDSRPATRHQNEALRYEIRMLDEWVRRHLAKTLDAEG
ncbi:DUF3016 domain-containing protein [Ferrimonas gelatinilytica]|uniref:DUF3016 domain-containing protein n=1 Tax=Ferrimonas gelatinilytica TaxID=1255257 RepID=A0ABP9S544_9GAMM